MLLEILLATGALGGLVGTGWYLHRRNNRAIPVAITEEQLQLLRLQPKISWCRFLENTGEHGKNVAAQYQLIRQIQLTSLDLLKQKFNAHEVTYARYKQAIDASNQILLDNLVKIIPLLETLDHTSREMWPQELLNKIESLYALNAQLIAKLNELIINLSQIKNLTGPDEQTTQFLLENLDKLVERAKQY